MNRSDLSHDDMCDLLAGQASDEVKRRYAEQIEDPDSFANRWMDEMHTKLSNPFGFSLARLMTEELGQAGREYPLSDRADTVLFILQFIIATAIGIAFGWSNWWLVGLVAFAATHLAIILVYSAVFAVWGIREGHWPGRRAVALFVFGPGLLVGIGLGWWFGWTVGLAACSPSLCVFLTLLVIEEIREKNQEVKQRSTVDMEEVFGGLVWLSLIALVSVGWLIGWTATVVVLISAIGVCLVVGSVYLIIKSRHRRELDVTDGDINDDELSEIAAMMVCGLCIVSGLAVGLLYGWIAGLVVGFTAWLAAVAAGVMFVVVREILRELSRKSVFGDEGIFVTMPKLTGWQELLFAFIGYPLAMMAEFVVGILEEFGDFRRAVKAAKVRCVVASCLWEDEELRLTRAMLSLGRLYCLQGQYASARPQLHRALSSLMSWRKFEGKAEELGLMEQCAYLLGVCYGQLQDDGKAMQYSQDSLKRSQERGNNVMSAVSLNNLGIGHHRKGEYSQATEFYRQAAEKSRTELGDRHLLTGIAVGNLASALTMIDDHGEEAQRSRDESRSVLRSRLPADHAAFSSSGGFLQLAVRTRTRWRADWHPVLLAV